MCEQRKLGTVFYSARVIAIRHLMLIDLRGQLLTLKFGELAIDLCEASADSLLILAGKLAQRRIVLKNVPGPGIHQP